MGQTIKMAFQFGQLVATPGALDVFSRSNDHMFDYIRRHGSCDWGDMTESDKKLNDEALNDGGRIFSSYVLKDGKTKVWIITEAEGNDGKRASTCVLLPEEY